MSRRTLGLLLCMLAMNCGAPVVVPAAQAAPAAAANSRAFAGKIEIDARLDRYPKLRALLIAAGRRELALQQKEADEMRRTDRATFGENKWTFERTITLRTEAGQYVSILSNDYTFTGGAHPNTSINAGLWDKNAERLGTAFVLFADASKGGRDMTTLAHLVREALAKIKRSRGADVDANLASDEWLKNVAPDVEMMGRPTLAPSTIAGKSSGMTFHFSPYEVGPYAEGPYTAFVPAGALAPLLKQEARGLFAGERPAADAKDE